MRQPPKDRPNSKDRSKREDPSRTEDRSGPSDRLEQKDRPGGAKRSKPERITIPESTPKSDDSLKEDAELIWSALRGKESAFAKLLKKYRRPVYSLALKMLGQEEDAEDTAQEAFIRAFQSLDTCDPERPFQRWIYRITYNLCVDRYRRRKPFAISLDQAVGEGEQQMELVDSVPAPDEVLGMRDEHRKVVELLYSLPPRYRVVVVLRHQEELSYEAIAEILGLPLGTVKARMHRAHNMLRKKLKRRET